MNATQSLTVFLALCVAQMLLASSSGAQDMMTTITTGGGEVRINNETNTLEMDDPFSDTPVLTLTPKAGHEVARALIVDGTSETIYEAQRIRYETENDAFLLEGDGLIERGADRLVGPTKIEYLPDDGVLLILGERENPAEIRMEKGERTFHSRAPGFQIELETIHDLETVRTLKQIPGSDES